MIDISKIRYNLILMSEDGKQYNIKDYVDSLGWEENEGTLSSRINFSARNEVTEAGLLSSLAKLGCPVRVFADDGSGEKEVARGYITDWKPVISNSADKFDVTCYDELYNLQKSKDNFYYSAGMSTKSVIGSIIEEWGIPMGEYSGPDITHGKLVYKSKDLSGVILDVLDDAKKHGGHEAILRAQEGKVNIIKPGSNEQIYCFAEDNTKTLSHKMSIADIVTRVKVYGKEEKEERAPVEATLNGLTKYGIRQKIYVREKDDTIAKAQEAAQEILDEEGQAKEELSVQGPDIPYIRKGDMVYLKMGALDGFYLVKGIRHDADSGSMSMDVEAAQKNEITEENEVRPAAKTYQVGDEVTFKGGTHYVSSYPNAKGYPARAGKAKITKKDGSGKAHPWHLIHTDSQSNVYGWVDEGTFE